MAWCQANRYDRPNTNLELLWPDYIVVIRGIDNMLLQSPPPIATWTRFVSCHDGGVVSGTVSNPVAITLTGSNRISLTMEVSSYMTVLAPSLS